MPISFEKGGGEPCNRESTAAPYSPGEVPVLDALQKVSLFPAMVYTYLLKFFMGDHEGGGDHLYNGRSLMPEWVVQWMCTLRDRIAHFQERRGIQSSENNFMSVLAVMIAQAGQAMYIVFSMFLALIPAASIIVHIAHFLLEQSVRIALGRTTRRETLIKVSILLLQSVFIYFILRFLVNCIFAPILSMQLTIITKLFLSVFITPEN